ncbi:MAG TPA: ubiquinone/menaquinone biosynthesis methyltransferase [Polyangia bacterium]|nr:ubiquinone/menaquinone biosynthesis methyltransferase [Polyangia bacterium]
MSASNASLAEAGADVQSMFNRVAKRYDAANRVMSGGIDIVWRKKAIGRLLEGLGETPRILDLGAGTLDGALEIARRAPGAEVAAADFAREMLRAGRTKLRGAAIATHAADGHDLPYRAAAFDGAFSAFCVRNLRELPRGLGELRRVVRPGGRVVLLEFLRPDKTRFFFDRIWNPHVLPLLGWAVTGDRAAYRYLPDSIAAFRSTAELASLMNEVGFASVETKALFPSGVATMVVAS